MDVKFFRSIYQVKKYWLSIIPDSDVRFYQTYCFNRLCFEYRITSVSNIKKGNVKTCFAVAFRDNSPVCIAPLIIDRNPVSTVGLLGTGSNAGKLDFIYNKKTEKSDIIELFNICRKKFKDKKFSFIFVDEKSPLTQCLEPIKNYENYAVKLEDYDEYFKSLSKSTRQNIRTAYNRMNTDDLNYKLVRYDMHSPYLENIIKSCNRIYQQRRLVWKNTDELPPERIIDKIRKRDIIYKTMRVCPRAAVYILLINEEIAAFFMGYEYENVIYIPRLAINDAFGKYSPGFIIINEYLKSVDKNNFVFDLGRGEESYKTKLNGEMSQSFLMVDG